MKSQIGVVYDKSTGLVASIIVPDDDRELNSVLLLASQGFVRMLASVFKTRDLRSVQAMLDRIIGKKPTRQTGIPSVSISQPASGPQKVLP